MFWALERTNPRYDSCYTLSRSEPLANVLVSSWTQVLRICATMISKVNCRQFCDNHNNKHDERPLSPKFGPNELDVD